MTANLVGKSKEMSVGMVDGEQRKMEHGEAALIFRNNGSLEVILSAKEGDLKAGAIPPRVFATVLIDIISQNTGVWPQLWDMAFKATSARLMKEKMDAAGISGT